MKPTCTRHSASRTSPASRVLHHRADLDLRRLNDELTHALNSRIVIEQAKGIIAENFGVEMVEAFALLRTYARNHSRLLSDVARDVIDGAGAGVPLPRSATPAIGDLGTGRNDRRGHITGRPFSRVLPVTSVKASATGPIPEVDLGQPIP